MYLMKGLLPKMISQQESVQDEYVEVLDGIKEGDEVIRDLGPWKRECRQKLLIDPEM